MNVKIKEKKIILGEIDIQPLINMEKLLKDFFIKLKSDDNFTELEEMGKKWEL